jgi:NAD(P) transhydrogenase subunit beta
MNSTNLIIAFSYLIASLLFIYGLKAMSTPKTARQGMNSAAAGMLLAVVGTLLHQDIINYTWIIIGLLIGGLAD